MNQNRDTFGSAGEAVLASILALAFFFLMIVQMCRRSGAWLLIFPMAWGFAQWAADSWRETFKQDTNVQPHSRRQGDVR